MFVCERQREREGTGTETMAGTWVAPAPEPEPAMEPLAALAGTQTNGSGGAEVPANQLDLISRSILSIASRLYVNIRNGPNNDSAAFFNLCISLARFSP